MAEPSNLLGDAGSAFGGAARWARPKAPAGDRPSPWQHWTSLVAGLSMAGIFGFDALMPLGVAAGLPYLAVLMLGHWSPWPRFAIWSASITTGLVVTAVALKPSAGGVWWMILTNRGLTVGGIWMVAFLVARSQARAQRLRAIVDTAIDGILTIDSKGIVQTFNLGAERLFGYRASDVIGRNVCLLMPAADARHHDASLRRFVDTGVAKVIGLGREVMGRRADGTEFPIKLSVSEIPTTGASSFAGIIHDLSDLRRAESALRRHRDELQQQVDDRTKDLALAKAAAEEAYRTKSTFLANMSHELRTPLNSVIGFSELLQTKAYGELSAKQHEFVEAILDSGRHLLALINDVLDLSKAEAGRIKLKEETVDIAELVEQARRILDPAMRAGDVSFSAELAENCRALRADRRLMFQVLLNLLSNACKFTPRGGHVGVTATRLGGEDISIQITDTGIGMSPAEIATALTPYGRADNEIARSREGTGLGLSLSKMLVELHGGSLEIASTPGKGTTVSLMLPRRVVDPNPGP
ncbi:MAG: PAS domain-containing sensor histidine kinase [Alphaproteobacteria bacterium]|nr:PAS domain-containing sensor histidine kinase [Alphaproteobacteria bacterium]